MVFNFDKWQSTISEIAIADYYSSKERQSYSVQIGYYTPYDVCSEDGLKKIEVKTDFKAIKSPNFCFEIENKNKPSGIYKTKANIWAQVIPTSKNSADVYEFKVTRLQEELENISHVVFGGDNKMSGLKLVPIDIAKKWCRKIYKINFKAIGFEYTNNSDIF